MDVREFRREDGERLRAFWVRCGIRTCPGDGDASLARTALHDPGLFLYEKELS